MDLALSDPQMWASLLTLVLLEIVLGIDNVIFISIAADNLPPHRRPVARRIGLGLALVIRLGLLATASWIVGLTAPVLAAFGHDISWRDILLISGGLFLLYKGTTEIHSTVEGDGGHGAKGGVSGGLAMVIVQIGILDMVFSFDSVITALGMTQHFPVMAIAIVISIGVMLFASGPIGAFVARHRSVKMLALSFLILIGMTLVADGLGVHVPKGYIYFAVAFSLLVEALNLLAARRSAPKPADARDRQSDG